MKIPFGLVLVGTLACFGSFAQAAPCLDVTLTGTQGGPPVLKAKLEQARWFVLEIAKLAAQT